MASHAHHHAGDATGRQPHAARHEGELQHPTGERETRVVIDCDRCAVRGIGCGDCVVTFLLGGPPFGTGLDDDERRAIDVLSDAGLVPPLRMVEPVDSAQSRYLDPA